MFVFMHLSSDRADVSTLINVSGFTFKSGYLVSRTLSQLSKGAFSEKCTTEQIHLFDGYTANFTIIHRRTTKPIIRLVQEDSTDFFYTVCYLHKSRSDCCSE